MSVCSLRNSVHNALATIHLFRDCFARNFEYSLVQREWDTLAVRTVFWATIIRPTRGTPQRFVNMQTKIFPWYPRALFVKSTKTNARGPLFSSTKHFDLRVDKSLRGTPGRANNSRPKYCANRESVPFTLDEAIFEVASEAISK